jgi:hypothetical protein
MAVDGSETHDPQLRAPWAASSVGLLFGILFTTALLLVRNQPMLGATLCEPVRQLATAQDLAGLIVPAAD